MTNSNHCFGRKRYNTLDEYFKKKYGGKVIKVSLNAGFTCPNIDGSKGTGGCTYCSSSGSGDFAGDPKESLLKQFDTILSIMHRKWKTASMYIPYFQAHTNTYAPLEYLKSCFEPFTETEGVVGIDIATRADCLPDDVLDYLEDLNSRCELTVELGLQTIFDKTGERINRCMTYDEFLHGYNALKERGIKVCVHLIDGLPGETADMMLESAKTVGALRPDFLKIHLLHVISGTRLAEEYARGEFKVLEMDEYIDILIRQLEVIPKETVMQRLTGDGARSTLTAPLWSIKKFEVLNEIDRQLEIRNTYQGRLFK